MELRRQIQNQAGSVAAAPYRRAKALTILVRRHRGSRRAQTKSAADAGLAALRFRLRFLPVIGS
jgi:hypothetical protein